MKRAVSTLLIGAALAGPAGAQLRVNKPADLAAPVHLAPGQGAIMVGFSRPDKMSAGKSGVLSFARYDVDKRDMIYQPKDAKKNGDTTTYWVDVRSKDKKSPAEFLVFPVSAGDYVLFGASPGPVAQVMNTFCLSAPTFRVNAGEVVYFGDVSPYLLVKMQNAAPSSKPETVGTGLLGGAVIKALLAEKGSAMAYSSHPDAARAALARHPELASAFKPAEIRNGATYACAGQVMTAYKVPGAPELGPPANAQVAASE